MAQAIVDPAELRRFANNLRTFNNELQARMANLKAQLGALGQSWRDQEQQKFQAELEATMVALKRFMEASNEHIPFLLRKADKVEEYLQQR